MRVMLSLGGADSLLRSHIRWMSTWCHAQNELGFRAFPRSLINAYGAKKAENEEKIQRSTVVIDKAGKIAAVWGTVRRINGGTFEPGCTSRLCVHRLFSLTPSFAPCAAQCFYEAARRRERAR